MPKPSERQRITPASQATRLRISLAQMPIRQGQPRQNREHVARLTAQACAAHAKPHILVLPELWSCGYALEEAARFASPQGREDAAFLGTLARRHNITFAGGSVLSAQQDGITNRAQVIHADGSYAAHYDKVHLFHPLQEDRFLRRGTAPLLFTLHGVRCACVLCYDIRFCEYLRMLALHGVELLIVAAQWPALRREHWECLLRARAIENQFFVAACNACGTDNGTVLAGHSAIIAPDGRYLAHGNDEEQLLSAVIDTAHIRAIRRSIPVYEDRVPDLYRGI